ncbi:MAG TPA: septum formation initiator family protein [Bryobacteraceae bacterium]|jgi:cell division protein FtsB|nr:septum formation initiator family protein [Bryobacteraceae bacterium]
MKAPLSRFAYGIALVIVAAYALFTLEGPHGFRALQEKRAQIRVMEKRNAGLAQEIERKREHIRRLEENPAEQELEIRERLKLARPNEKIYIIGEPAKK